MKVLLTFMFSALVPITVAAAPAGQTIAGLSAGSQHQTAAFSTESFGTASQSTVTLSSVAFHPWQPDVTWARTTAVGTLYLTGGTFPIALANLELPNGVLIEKLELFGCDTSPSESLQFYLAKHFPDGSGLLLGAVAATTGEPGCGIFTLTYDPPLQVDSNGGLVINVWMGTSQAIMLNGARVSYRLQVSPSPLTATFADVPTGHPFFRFVEALAAAGITGGCGGGNFCPNNAVTRGQMAVFLASALGLHFPN